MDVVGGQQATVPVVQPGSEAIPPFGRPFDRLRGASGEPQDGAHPPVLF